MLINCILSGGSLGPSGGYSSREEILEFNQETESWIVIGAMKEPRKLLAVSVISFDEYENWCN